MHHLAHIMTKLCQGREQDCRLGGGGGAFQCLIALGKELYL